MPCLLRVEIELEVEKQHTMRGKQGWGNPEKLLGLPEQTITTAGAVWLGKVDTFKKYL